MTTKRRKYQYADRAQAEEAVRRKDREEGMSNQAFYGNFAQLIREIEAAARDLDERPEDQEWAQEQLIALEDLCEAALTLSRSAKAIFDELRGRKA